MDPVEFFTQWLARNYGKLILLAVVLVVAALIDKALTKVVRRILDKSQVPNASIFVNILRVVVWAFAIGTLLQPACCTVSMMSAFICSTSTPALAVNGTDTKHSFDGSSFSSDAVLRMEFGMTISLPLRSRTMV